MPHSDQRIGFGIWQWLDQHTVQYAENRCVRANAQRQRHQRDGGKHRRQCQPTEDVFERFHANTTGEAVPEFHEFG